MKRLLFAFCLLSCTTWVSAQSTSLQEGIKHMENENYKAAQDIFTAIAKNDPKNGTIYFYIGEVSYLTEDYIEAEKSYKKGLSINAQCAECKVGLGKLMLDQGKTAEAEEYFGSAERLDKKNAEIYALIGEAYLLSKKPDGKKAVHYLTIARDMNPQVARYWTHLGDAFYMTGNNGEAMTCYETAVKKDPNDVDAYISMARIWASAKLLDSAILRLEEAIRIDPENAQAYKDLIELYIRDGQYDKVTPLLEKYVQLIGTDVDAKVRFVKFLTFQAKDYDRAILEGEKLLKTNPEQYTLHRWLAWSYAEKGEYQKSYEHSEHLFEEIGKKDDRAAYPSDYDYWAKAAFKIDSIDRAAHIYRKYLEFDPAKSQEIYGMLAKAYFDKKNYEQAIAYYNRKGAEKPLSTTDEHYLGHAYYYLEKNLEADSAFARILAITPDYSTGWLMRARISNRLDTAETVLYLSKPYYENYITYVSKDKDVTTLTDPMKKNLIESYRWLAQYWANQESDMKVKAENEVQLNMVFTPVQWTDYCLAKVKGYYESILILNPMDENATENLKILNGGK